LPNHFSIPLRAVATIAFASPLAGTSAAADRAVDFNRDVRPILTKNCTTCHGGVKKAAGVSYLFREDVLGLGESGNPIVVPGDPDGSEMIRRLRTDNPDLRMPPPDEHPEPLPEEDVETLVRWIDQGAPWAQHWAFEPPEEPEVPEVADADWPRQPLDRFILARLESEGLEPAAEADPAEWLRRVSLDLTGLPPTLEAFEDFRSALDRDPQAARAGVVDRLLESPAYGERWTSMWLDLARYSDTFGFEKDPHREIWPYRDWVVDAFNGDMPFDEFTIRQLAGDLLENPEPGDLIATAFHRNTQNNTEGGTDDEEYRMAAVIDRTNTTWTAWNASTFGCVQCHDHPYDPIPHENYYEFLAFFNNSEDVDLNSDFPKTKAAGNPERQGEVVRLEQAIEETRREINDRAREVAKSLDGWTLFRAEEARAEPETGRLDQSADGDLRSSGTTPNRTVFKLRGPAAPLGAIQLEILPESDNPAEWDERGAVVTKFEAALVGPDGARREIPLREVVADFLAGPFDPNDSLKNGRQGFGEYPMMKGPRTAWIVPEKPVDPRPGETLELVLRHGAVCNGNNQNTVLRRFRLETTADPALASFVATEKRADAWRELESLRQQYNGIEGSMIPVMRERSDAAERETRLFIRGNRNTLDRVVEPGIPEFLGGPGNADDRLDMARWLVSDDNPLAARVLANRLWAQLFGVGLVATLGDFGSSGANPSHPQLLEHLALRLRDHHDWHLKPFLRELVLSATYRQNHRATPELLEKDPQNRLLARGPRQRLNAEMVRDQALLVSGLLHRETGGRPVYPPQPDGIWRSVYNGQKWETSTGPGRYRRALYTYHKRTAGYPAFLTFDAPARDVCSAQRIPTNTPLQALVTLNDPAHIEFAQAFAERMAAAGSDLRVRLARGYRLLTLRDPSPEVLDTLASLHADATAEYRNSPKETRALADSPEQAALVLVANTLLNSDLALNR
jgi:hypothetical protein